MSVISTHLIVEEPITTAADNILVFIVVFTKKRPDICADNSHVIQALFSLIFFFFDIMRMNQRKGER